MASNDLSEPLERYALLARALHWLMALGFAFMWACGYAITSLVADDSPLEELLFDLHISIGVTLLALLVVRVAIRFLIPPPPLPQGFSKREKTASHLGHLGLYVLPAAVITFGWAETNFDGHDVTWFGTAMPKIFPTMETLYGVDIEDVTGTLHMWLAYAMLALVIVHVAAVAKHRWVDRHDVLYRMTFGLGKS